MLGSIKGSAATSTTMKNAETANCTSPMTGERELCLGRRFTLKIANPPKIAKTISTTRSKTTKKILIDIPPFQLL